MSEIIAISYDENLYGNTVCWIYNELNDFIPYSMNVLYAELPTFLEQVSHAIGNFHCSGIVFTPNSTYKITLIENRATLTLITDNLDHPLIKALNFKNKISHFTKSLETITSDIHKQWANYDNKQVNSHEKT